MNPHLIITGVVLDGAMCSVLRGLAGSYGAPGPVANRPGCPVATESIRLCLSCRVAQRAGG